MGRYSGLFRKEREPEDAVGCGDYGELLFALHILVANHLPEKRECLRRAQIIPKDRGNAAAHVRLTGAALGFRRDGTRETSQALQSGVCRLERLPGEGEGRTIGCLQEEITQRERAAALVDDVGHVDLIAFGLLDLAVVYREECAMHPKARELFAERCFGLRYLVGVMDRDMVDASRMDIERLA